MNMTYLFSQIIGFISFILSLIAYHRNKKEKILKTMLLANVVDILQYFLLGAYTGCASKLITLVRNEILILKEKNKKFNKKTILIAFLIIYLISGIITYENIYSLFPISASMIYLYFIWNGNELQVKKVAFYCYFLWLIYNISVFSIAGITANCISIISTAIAIHNEKNR